VSLAFLSPVADNGVVARSPMERLARAAGAQFEVRDGWNVPLRYEGETEGGPVAWADVSHLRKWEVRGAWQPRGANGGGGLGTARREGEAWWCGLTPERALVLGGTAPEGALDVTCNYAALTILGPQARETIARFCALDLRPDQAPPHSFRPGSIARQPGMIVVEAPDRFLLLFGWALAEYMWTVVADAAEHLGGAPIGIEALGDA
jgi:glycine cleavage system aminomethyltransferase T